MPRIERNSLDQIDLVTSSDTAQVSFLFPLALGCGPTDLRLYI